MPTASDPADHNMKKKMKLIAVVAIFNLKILRFKRGTKLIRTIWLTDRKSSYMIPTD